MNAESRQTQLLRTRDGVRIASRCTTKRDGNCVARGPVLVATPAWWSHLGDPAGEPDPLQALADCHTVLRYDARGCGLSDWQSPAIGLDGWLQDLAAVVESAGPAPVVLLGRAWGAAVAVAYAARHPERVSALVLSGGFAQGRLCRGQGAPAALESETVARLAELGWDRADAAFRQVFATQMLPDGTQAQHQAFNEQARRAICGLNAAQMLRAADRIDVTDLLPLVRCPTLVLHSLSDRSVPYEQGRLLACGIAGAELATVHSSNHQPVAGTAAAQQWQARVSTFLAAHATPVAEPGVATLTPRQHELLELVAQGQGNPGIAVRLGLSEKTVRNHITSLFSKLEVENRSQAIVRARRAGLGLGLGPGPGLGLGFAAAPC